jgi:2-dehydro-3-deoxyphosphooctonate aldolase (KDO 8-P synthase)
MCGPNVIESEEHTLFMAKELKKIFIQYNAEFIFKVSFDKANRSSLNSYRGLGFEEGLKILKKVKEEVGVKIITDIHESWQAKPIGEIVDVIQIPAFLCRQTDLLKAAAETGKIIHVKKGQMCSAEQMHKCKEKIISFGNPNVILCERGNSFGYQDLVVDPRNLIWLKSDSNLVSMDITHCLQQPSQKMSDGTVKSGGYRDLIPTMGKMAIALGVDGIFMEVHNNPDNALCDGPTQWYLDKLEWLLDYFKIEKIKNITNDIKNKINFNIKKKVAFVCIRFNNTRLPNKNILDLNGKPLCYWIFDKLKYIKGIDDIYVYCSNKKILKYLPEGIKFVKRDEKFDGNNIKANELLYSFSQLIKSDYYLLCHATCPFLKVSTIQKLINNFDELKYDSGFTCKKYQTFLWNNKEPMNFLLNDIPRTQDMEPFYIENVGAYLYNYNEICKNNRRIGNKPLKIDVSDIECVDIDNLEDYNFALQLQNLLPSTYDN